MSNFKVLDLFCKAGGCSRGYEMAGFIPTGVDIEKQKRYPYEFIQSDALEILLDHDFLAQFAFIHASPPCQCYSVTKHLSNRRHPDLVGPVRELLLKTGKPFVIENVVGAPLINPVRLCGSSFGLDLRRHRLFESDMLLMGKRCRHKWQKPRFPRLYGSDRRAGKLSTVVCPVGHGAAWSRHFGATVLNVGVNNEFCDGVAEWRRAMQIDWMTRDELAQAIPPAYTRLFGEQIMRILRSPNKSPLRRRSHRKCRRGQTKRSCPLENKPKSLKAFAQAHAIRLPLADDSVDLVMGSPPYMDARSYGINAQRGVGEWIDFMLRCTARRSASAAAWFFGLSAASPGTIATGPAAKGCCTSGISAAAAVGDQRSGIASASRAAAANNGSAPTSSTCCALPSAKSTFPGPKTRRTGIRRSGRLEGR